MKKFFIFANNIHSGGGFSILKEILAGFQNQIVDVILFVDSRADFTGHFDLISKIKVVRVRSTLIHRILSEISIWRQSSNNDIALFLGNLPPLFRLRSKVYLYVHNRYLVEDFSLSGFPMSARFRIRLERLWLRFFSFNSDELVVQSSSMKTKLLHSDIEISAPISIMPIYKSFKNVKQRSYKKSYQFIYVASGDPHKNHQILIDAWVLLAKEHIFPSLCLTIDKKKFKSLANYINFCIKEFDIKIFNQGSVLGSRVQTLYLQSNALIFPSLFESFGLPLLEAKDLGLSILASELDFVRDLIEPDEAFDPKSSISIARSVKRFLALSNSRIHFFDGKNFIRYIIDGNN